ncbi:MAG: O-antigen ligase family protein [Pedobacter sp.]
MNSAISKYVAPVRLFKSKLRTSMLAIFFLLSFSTLKYLPSMFLTAEIWFIAVFIFLVLVYFPKIAIHKYYPSPFEKYGFFLLIYVPLVSAFMASAEFGQPWIYSILAQRGLVLVGCMLIFLSFYRKGAFSLGDVERALLWLAWISLILCTLVVLFLDPRQFVDIPTFVVGVGDDLKFVLPTTFLVFGLFYYVFSSFWQNSLRNLCLALLFFGYLIFGSGGRTQILAVIFSCLFFVIRWRSKSRLLVFLSRVSFIILLLISIACVSNSKKLTFLKEKFYSAYMVVLTAEKGSDISANSRIDQSNIALPYVKKNFMLGNGLISHQWNGGYKSLFDYFHPSDVGLLGIMYLYGVVGLFVYAYQFRFALQYSKRLPNHGGKWGNLICAVRGILFYYAITSLVTGQFVHSVGTLLIFIAILYSASMEKIPSAIGK